MQRPFGEKFHLIWGYDISKKMAHLTLEQRYKIEAYRSLGKILSEISEYVGNNYRSFHGIIMDEPQCRAYLQGAVKDNLLDREERKIR